MLDPNAQGGPTPPPSSNEPVPGQPAPPPKPRRRRLWLKVLAVVVVVLILIVLLFPTLASTRPVRSIVLRQVNSRLNGRLDVADWSVGWFGNLRLDGVRVFDAGGSQLVELRSVTTGTSLSKLARGNLDLGKVVVSGLDFNIKREADGTLNLAKLMKEEPKSEPAPAPQQPQQPAPAGQPSAAKKEQKLPDIKADLQLEDTHGTFEDVAKRQTVKFVSITGEVKVPDINQPIEDTLEIVLEPLGFPQGKISASGSVLAVRQNVLDTSTPDVDQKLTISNLDLAAAEPMLGNAVTELAGLTGGTFAVRLKPQQDGVISGEFSSTNFKLATPAMNGDTFKADSVVITIPPITLPTAKGLDQLTAGRLTVGKGDNNKITLVWKSGEGATASQSSVGFGADVPLAALLNVADRKPPGDTGTVTLAVDVDAAHLANSMPHMVALRPGVRLDSGRFTLSTDVNLTPDQTRLSQKISIVDVKGANTTRNQPIALQPITLTLSAASQGGSGTIPDLRNIQFDLASGFATGHLAAANLGDVSGTLLQGQLENVQKELGQIVDFGDVQLAGAFNVGISSKGNLVGDAAPAGAAPKSAAFALPVTITGLHIAGLKSSAPVEAPGAAEPVAGAPKKEAAVPLPPVDVQSINIKIGATLLGGADMFVQAVKGFDLTAQAGATDQPTLDAQLTGDIAFVAGTGIDKTGKAAPTTSISTDNLRLAKMNFDLARAQQQFGALMPFLEKAGLVIRQGVVTAGFTAAYDGKKATARDVTLALNNVTMDKRPTPTAAPTAVLDNYTMTFKTAATYASDAGESTFNVSTIDLSDNKNMVSVKNNGDTVVHLTAGPDGAAVPALQMLQKAGITISIPSVSQLQAFLNAISPPEPVDAQAAKASGSGPAPAPLPPLEVTAGAATITLTATGGQKLAIHPTILAKGLAVRRGPASYPVGDVFVDTAVSILSGTAPPASTQPSVIDQIAELRVEQFGVSAVASDIHLKEPLIVKDLAHLADLFAPAADGKGGAPSLNAALVAKGDVGQIMNLVQVLGGTVPATAYAGTYSLDQQVTTAGGPLVAKGNAHIDNFSVQSGTAQFAEKSIQLDNDVSLDAAKQTLAISNVALAMQSTNALVLKITGGVDDLNTRRVLKNINADLSYDAAALWKLIYPTMSAEQRESLKDVKVGGQFQRKILAGGEFPANKPFNEAIKTVKAQGGLAIQSFEGKGITVADLEIPFTLSDGQFRIAYPDKPAGQDLPAPAKCNGGTLALGGASVDLSQEHPRLNIPKDTKLMTNVSLNAVLAQTCGDFVNNPLFVGADNAAGILNINIAQCDQFPTDSLMMQQVAENNGYLKMNVAIGKIQIGNANLQKLSGVLGSIKFFQRNVNLANLQGEVPNYTIEIKNGVVNTDMTMNVLGAKQPLHLTGPVVMQSKKMNMTLDLPLALLGVQTGKSGAAGLTGGSLRLPMTGTVNNPNFGDVGAIVQKNFVENGVGSLLGGLTGGQKGTNQEQPSGGGLGGLIPGLGGSNSGGAAPAPDAGSGPAAPATDQAVPGNPTTQPADETPLGDLEKLLEKKKDKDKKKKRKPATQPQ